MKKYTPFEKLSKKKQRELNAQRRGTWNGVNPVTRRPENPKAYNRRKAQKWKDDSNSVPFVMSQYFRMLERCRLFYLLHPSETQALPAPREYHAYHGAAAPSSNPNCR